MKPRNTAELAALLEPIEKGPFLFRINGIGTTLAGWMTPLRSDPHICFKVTMFTFVFLPVFPIKIYLCTRIGPTTFHAYGGLSWARFLRCFGSAGLIQLVATAYLASIVFFFAILAFLIALGEIVPPGTHFSVRL